MFDIRRSNAKGLGLFASYRIPQGTVISSEAPLFFVEQPTAIRILRQFTRLPTDLRQEYVGLTIREDADKRLECQTSLLRNSSVKNKGRRNATEPSKLEQYVTALSTFKRGADGVPDRALREAAKVVAIFHNNAWTLRNENDSRLLFGVFMREARIHHCFLPNTICAWNQERGNRTIVAMRDIKAGEEITKSYIDLEGNREARRQQLRDQCGFTCCCLTCSGE